MPPKPLILGFDTSAAHCAAALLLGDELIATKHEDMGKGQAERLFPLLEELLAEANATWSNLSAIGVGVGPGNFTGIRIAVSAARGLGLSLGVPVVGVSNFEALQLGTDHTVLCAVAAPRDGIYVQTLPSDGTSPVLCTVETAPLPNPKAEATVIGHRSEELAQRAGGRAAEPQYPLAEAIARKALSRKDNVNLPRPAPMYIRPADAKPPSDPPPVILS